MEALTYINDSKWKITIYQEIYEQQKIKTSSYEILLEPEFSHNSLLILTIS